MECLSSTEKFEQAILKNSEDCILQLYVAGCSPRSQKAIANLQRICRDNSTIIIHLEIIDILQQPDLAKQNQIFAVPTLIRKSPTPIRLFVGDLSDTEALITGLTA